MSLERSRRISVAPMMDWTDRHCRAFHRVATADTLLCTEMVVDQAILHGDLDRLIGYSPAEHPLACQLGGSDPTGLAEAARSVAAVGYDEVNLNVGCPSDRVQSGRFGACLMAEPELVANCVKAMQDAVSIPVTVKSRIGIDEQDSYDAFRRFIDTVAAAGCSIFTVHARKAILSGLSPKENREVPPLKYDYVRRLKAERPDLTVVLNGGVPSLEEAAAHLAWADGVMIGRAAYQTPAILLQADRLIAGDPVETPTPDLDRRLRVWVRDFLPYIEEQRRRGVGLHRMTRHMLGLFNGRPGARAWRRYLSENAYSEEAGPETVERALGLVPSDADLAQSA